MEYNENKRFMGTGIRFPFGIDPATNRIAMVSAEDDIKEAIRILFSTPGVKAVLINIFGGITRCDEVAGGVKMALEKEHSDKIVVVRMEGTNKEIGLATIADIKNADIVSVPGLRECVKALADRRDRL